jgi:hypothetical protein
MCLRHALTHFAAQRYVGDKIQNESVAIETAGITVSSHSVFLHELRVAEHSIKVLSGFIFQCLWSKFSSVCICRHTHRSLLAAHIPMLVQPDMTMASTTCYIHFLSRHSTRKDTGTHPTTHTINVQRRGNRGHMEVHTGIECVPFHRENHRSLTLHTQTRTQIVRRGKGRVTWKGTQTLNAFPYLEKLGQKEGVVDFLTTEFSTSTEKNFPLVEFIDTPGLTDGMFALAFGSLSSACSLSSCKASLSVLQQDPQIAYSWP